MNNNNSLLRHLAWLGVVAIVGAAALGVVALRRGEAIKRLVDRWWRRWPSTWSPTVTTACSSPAR
ncbi:hypothetical protein ACPA9J_26350 [Pseudomonas aeruginosa]